jgi:hypothetical protein
MEERTSSSGIGTKFLAIVVLAVIAWLVLKVVIGIVAGVAWAVVAVAVIFAAVWALRQF